MKALVEAARNRDSALIVGLDPDPARFPVEFDGLVEHESVREFCFGVLEAVEPYAAAVKPQSAYFERLGVEGAAVYADVIRESSRLGLPVIADVKRGDIGPTSEAYAEAHLNRFGAACVTLNPYMGEEAIEPFLEVVRGLDAGGGVFVLVATSNRSSVAFQEATTPPVYEVAARLVADLGRMTDSGYADAGAVVGVTRPEVGRRVREMLPDAIFLAPGYGAQGGGADAVRSLLGGGGNGRQGSGVLVNSSRAVLYAHEKREDGDYRLAAAEAARQTRDELRSIGAGL